MTAASAGGAVEPRDEAVVAGQLGRQPHDLTGIAVRCPHGYAAIIETAPLLSDGSPNPTLLYITCPTMVAAVSRAEAAGGVRLFKSASQTEKDLRDYLGTVTRLYQERRAELAGGRADAIRRAARLDAGVGGPEGPQVASCLHAYAAALLAVMSEWLGGIAHGGRPGSGDPQSGPELSLISEARATWERFLPPVSDCWCHDRRCARWIPEARRAVIDVGTISVRLLVADVVGGRPQTVIRRAEVTRLGQGLQAGAPLAAESRWRTAEVVARFVREARAHAAGDIVLAGTSAAREACDGEAFMEALGRDNGVKATVLSGRREAELAYAGAGLDLPAESAAGPMVLLDVGGGSTELMSCSADGVVDVVSLEIGASRGTQRWISSDPPSPDELEAVYRDAERVFTGLRGRFGRAPEAGAAAGARARARTAADAGARRLVGVAGTVTTLACLDAGLKEYDGQVLHLRGLSVGAVRRITGVLSAMTTEERAALPCVQAGRAPVIVAGAVIVLAALETFGYDRLTVSERDLLDGLLLYGG